MLITIKCFFQISSKEDSNNFKKLKLFLNLKDDLDF